MKTDLTNYGIILEELGGDVQCVEISAKKGAGIDELLEKVLLQVEVLVSICWNMDSSLP